MKFLDLLKWSWKDACDPSHSCLNEYHVEKGYKEWNALIPKSEYFEKQVFESMSKVYGYGLKKILADLYIPNLNGHTTQLDLVFINKTGIYVVEAKNYTCMIKGTDEGKWDRREYMGGKLSKADNPVKQNANHVKCMEKLLHYYPKEYFKSIVVFADSCRFEYENTVEYRYDTEVINFRDVKECIKFMSKNSEEVFSDENVYRIYNELSEYARADYETRKAHLEYVKSLN